MAAETSFGTSFGDPRRYMGQSPIAEVGKALKTFGIAYGIQESGLSDWLNKQGISQNKEGTYQYSKPKAAPAGAVAPTSVSPGQLPAVPQAPENMNWGTMMPNGAQAPIAPATSMAPVSPMAPTTIAPQTQIAPPPDVGNKILDNDDSWQHSSYTNPESSKDFNPLTPQTGYNQMLATGDEYKNAPGYGKLAKALQTMGGMG